MRCWLCSYNTSLDVLHLVLRIFQFGLKNRQGRLIMFWGGVIVRYTKRYERGSIGE